MPAFSKIPPLAFDSLTVIADGPLADIIRIGLRYAESPSAQTLAEPHAPRSISINFEVLPHNGPHARSAKVPSNTSVGNRVSSPDGLYFQISRTGVKSWARLGKAYPAQKNACRRPSRAAGKLMLGE